MKIVAVHKIIAAGSFPKSPDWRKIKSELCQAIRAVVWPPGAKTFTIYDSTGRSRGQGNGVKPIKDACMMTLEELGWGTRERRNPLRLDAVKRVGQTRYFGLEWETGNISSSHRSVNRILRGHLEGLLQGGALIVPSGSFYKYLTDRVGNLPELEPYFDLWKRYPLSNGMLTIFVVEHDAVSMDVPRIEKATDGRALV